LVDLDFLTEWYPQYGLPPSLAKDLDASVDIGSLLADIEPLSESDFKKRLGKKLQACIGAHRPCHDEKHASQVMERGARALRILSQLLGFGLLSEGLYQAFMLALAGHDHGHPGTTWLKDADSLHLPPMPLNLGGVHADYPAEYVTSCLNDEQNQRDGISLAFRCIETYVDWSSSNGGDMELGRKMQIDTVQPKGLLGWLMRAVDVTFSNDLTTNSHFEAKLLWIEAPAKPAPTTMKGLIANRSGFLEHVEKTYDELDEAVRRVMQNMGIHHHEKLSLTALAGWQGNLAIARENVQQMINGDAVVMATVETALVANGVALEAA
jgi:hypothetical protein